MNQTAQDTPSPLLALDASVWFFAGQLDESEPVRHVPIHSLPFRVGRRPDLALCIPSACISKEHAEIDELNGELVIRDLGSTNGTYVNGSRISESTSLKEGDIVQFATVVFRVGRQQETGPEGGTIEEDACDRALALVQFDRLIEDRAVVPFFQPIVEVTDSQAIIGYEVLGRSRLFGLRTPKEMFATASRLNLEAELSRVFRLQGIEIARAFPPDVNLFVNTHPVELTEDGLIDSLCEIRDVDPEREITLEIHEAAITNTETIIGLRSVLRDLDMKLAFDDFGAGQARLVELSEVRPDYLKFDMQLVQGIHRASASRQQVVALLVQMVNELGIIPLAEGVEYRAEHRTLQEMGFGLGQGFFYGRPAAITSLLS